MSESQGSRPNEVAVEVQPWGIYVEDVTAAARAIHASDLEHVETLELEGERLGQWDELDEADRMFYMRAAGAALRSIRPRPVENNEA